MSPERSAGRIQATGFVPLESFGCVWEECLPEHVCGRNVHQIIVSGSLNERPGVSEGYAECAPRCEAPVVSKGIKQGGLHLHGTRVSSSWGWVSNACFRDGGNGKACFPFLRLGDKRLS